MKLPKIKLHNEVLGAKGVDHVNGNRLDNRKSNLRIATASQNGANARLRGSNLIGFKGVSQKNDSRQHGRWFARIRCDYRQVHLGNYDTPEEAALAYNFGAIFYFGEFACGN